jgi:hypothetical protein
MRVFPWIGVALALLASLGLNAGYVLQHRGSSTAPAVDPRRPVRTLGALLRSRWWLAGGLVGCMGWALHVAAVSRAPLSLVQAFVAAGMVFALPLAARVTGRAATGAERAGVALMALSLALLVVGFGDHHHHHHHHAGLISAPVVAYLITAAGMAVVLAALPLVGESRASALAIAGGVLYGAADMAIKVTTRVGVATLWPVAAAVLTAGAFFAFQRALQTGRVLPVIALMTAATNIVSIGGALAVLGDPLGRTPALAALHTAAFGLVVVAGWLLAPAQAALAVPDVQPA